MCSTDSALIAYSSRPSSAKCTIKGNKNKNKNISLNRNFWLAIRSLSWLVDTNLEKVHCYTVLREQNLSALEMRLCVEKACGIAIFLIDDESVSARSMRYLQPGLFSMPFAYVISSSVLNEKLYLRFLHMEYGDLFLSIYNLNALQALYMSMTVREHLQLYTALKGVPEPRSLAVETALQALNLSGNKHSFTYMELL